VAQRAEERKGKQKSEVHHGFSLRLRAFAAVDF
jgi:hypothetical protein